MELPLQLVFLCHQVATDSPAYSIPDVLFMDAVHPTQATKLSHGWIRTGQDKAIETTGSRSHLNIVGTLNLSEIGRTVIDNYESINSENIVRFLCKLRESYPLTHKLHLILDSAGYHRSD